MDVRDVRLPSHVTTGTDAAVVIDAEGGRWVIRAPQTAAAGAALEAEVALLEALVGHVDAGALPFEVPRPSGFAELTEGGRAVIHRQLAGLPLRLEQLGPGPGLAAATGRAIAALHELPPTTIENTGMPSYEADDYRRRRLTEVDEAARTGLVPTTLLRRWEQRLEDVALWRFRPTVVHGDLSAEQVLCTGDRPTAVLGWSEAKVADPADDLAWLLVAAPEDAVDAILEAYNLRRAELRDPHLMERALLAGELALARWLLHGVRFEATSIIEDAVAMLADLDEQTREPVTAPGVDLGEETEAVAAESPEVEQAADPDDADETEAGDETEPDDDTAPDEDTPSAPDEDPPIISPAGRL